MEENTIKPTYAKLKHNIRHILFMKGLRGNSEKARKFNSARQEAFIIAIMQIKKNYNIVVSLTWLKDLLHNTPLTWRKKQDKIINLMKATAIKTEGQTYYFKERHKYGNGEIGYRGKSKTFNFLKI